MSDSLPAAQEYRPRDAGKLSQANPQDILDRIAAGELQRDIAKEYGVTRQAVGWYISKTVPDGVWKQVKRQSIDARLEQAAAEMEAADDALALARAREAGRLWMWRAEREHPDIWGAKQQVDMRIEQVDLGDRLRRAQARTIEGSATVVSAQPAAEVQRSISDNRDNPSHS